jgi:hypothetical protein
MWLAEEKRRQDAHRAQQLPQGAPPPALPEGVVYFPIPDNHHIGTGVRGNNTDVYKSGISMLKNGFATIFGFHLPPCGARAWIDGVAPATAVGPLGRRQGAPRFGEAVLVGQDG